MQIKEFLKKVIDQEIGLIEQEQYLLSKDSYSAQELADAVNFLYENISKKPEIGSEFLDVCGTGGSGLPRINTSTLSAYILSRKGIKVAKHGNKAASGRCGSFDLLERILEEFPPLGNLHFLNAREFYPVMANFAEVRKKIGKPTFFNLLGPLLSPIQAENQIIGTSFEDKMELIIETCKLLGRKKVMVVRGDDGLDEITLTGASTIYELNNGKVKKYKVSPSDFGVDECDFNEIKGGDIEMNYKIAKSILTNNCETRHLDLVLVNAALALKLLGICDDLKSAYKLIKSGNILDVILASDKREFLDAPVSRSEKSFKSAIETKGKSLILEVKMASPTAGRILDQDVESIVSAYNLYGASAISVVTEPNYFNGSFELLEKVSNLTHLPILCKDFVTKPEHITTARIHGADAILLIARILNVDEIKNLTEHAQNLGMDVLCEVHDQAEMQKAIDAGAEIIGVNNRNLDTFVLDLETTNKLADMVPDNALLVSESGIKSSNDVKRMNPNVEALLIGTNVLKSNFVPLKIRELKGEPLVKICGVRSLEEAKYCEEVGVDMIGLNFVDESHRCISKEEAFKISELNILKVGVFQNLGIDLVNEYADEFDLDMIQLSGDEDQTFIDACKKPVIKTVKNGKQEFDCEYLILDGTTPGSGKEVASNTSAPNKEFMIAGGLTPENVASKIIEFDAIGADAASGIETEKKLDLEKVKLFFNNAKHAYRNEN